MAVTTCDNGTGIPNYICIESILMHQRRARGDFIGDLASISELPVKVYVPSTYLSNPRVIFLG